MFKHIIMCQGKEFDFFEAVFSWGSIYAFTLEQLRNELAANRISLN